RRVVSRGRRAFPTRRSSDLDVQVAGNEPEHLEAPLEVEELIAVGPGFTRALHDGPRVVARVATQNVGDTHGTARAHEVEGLRHLDRKSTRLNSSHVKISYAV